MNYRVKRKDDPYLQVDKTGIGDTNLSPISLGVLVYILSKPDNWKAHKNEILNRFKGSLTIKTTQNMIDNAFIELRKAGYVSIVPVKGKDGKLKGSEYVFSEVPEMPTSSDVGKSSEMPISSDLGGLSSVEDVPSYNKELSILINNDLNLKKNKSVHALKNFENLEENKEKNTPLVAPPPPNEKWDDPDDLDNTDLHKAEYVNDPFKILSSQLRDSELYEILELDYLNDEVERNSFDAEFTKIGTTNEKEKLDILKSLCSVYVSRESTGKAKNKIYSSIRLYIRNQKQFESKKQSTVQKFDINDRSRYEKADAAIF